MGAEDRKFKIVATGDHIKDQANAWCEIHDLCYELGLKLKDGSSVLEQVKKFIRERKKNAGP